MSLTFILGPEGIGKWPTVVRYLTFHGLPFHAVSERFDIPHFLGHACDYVQDVQDDLSRINPSPIYIGQPRRVWVLTTRSKEEVMAWIAAQERPIELRIKLFELSSEVYDGATNMVHRVKVPWDWNAKVDDSFPVHYGDYEEVETGREDCKEDEAVKVDNELKWPLLDIDAYGARNV